MNFSRQLEESEAVDCEEGRQLCVYCKRPLLRRREGMNVEEIARTATKDHKTPKALGGTNDRDNLVIACARCNGAKGHIPYSVFKVFADFILIPYPDIPAPVLRNTLNVYIMHLLEMAVGQNKKALRDACTLALLSLAQEIKSFETGKGKKNGKKKI